MTTISQIMSDNETPARDRCLHLDQEALQRRRARRSMRENSMDPLLQASRTRLARLSLFKRQRAWNQSDLRNHLTQGHRKRLVEVIAHEGKFKKLLIELVILRLTQVHQQKGAVVVRKGQNTFYVRYGGEPHGIRISDCFLPNKTQRERELNHQFCNDFTSQIVVRFSEVLKKDFLSYFSVDTPID